MVQKVHDVKNIELYNCGNKRGGEKVLSATPNGMFVLGRDAHTSYSLTCRPKIHRPVKA